MTNHNGAAVSPQVAAVGIIALCVYIVGMAGIAIWAARRQERNREECMAWEDELESDERTPVGVSSNYRYDGVPAGTSTPI
jgi:hypothetical protein